MEESDRDVDYINMETKPPVAVMEDGEVLAVVSWLDADGDVEEDPDQAAQLLAGPCRDGYFYYIHVAPGGALFS